jgi:Fe-S-cluster containining protein
VSEGRFPRAAFVCRRCGNCCRGRGGIHLGEDGLFSLSLFLGLAVEDLKEVYLKSPAPGLYEVRSREAPGFPCLFLEGGGCRIHPVKPLACRYWPFYRSLLQSEEAWREAGECCPGLSGADHSAFLAAFSALRLPFPPKSFKDLRAFGPAGP